MHVQVGDIMTADVKTCPMGGTFAEAAKVMHGHGVASVIVVDAGGRASGIVTERDLTNAVADDLDPKMLPLKERMTTSLVTVERRTDISEAARLMAEKGIRHLPVVEEGKLLGIVSIRDLWRWALGELTGGHELPDLERAYHAMTAAAAVHRAK